MVGLGATSEPPLIFRAQAPDSGARVIDRYSAWCHAAARAASVGKAFASDFVPDQLRASAVGWYNATVGLLQLAASVVAGLLWDRAGHAAVSAYGAAFALVGIIALSLFQPGRVPGESSKT